MSKDFDFDVTIIPERNTSIMVISDNLLPASFEVKYSFFNKLVVGDYFRSWNKNDWFICTEKGSVNDAIKVDDGSKLIAGFDTICHYDFSKIIIAKRVITTIKW
jgi:hypothetical protein